MPKNTPPFEKRLWLNYKIPSWDELPQEENLPEFTALREAVLKKRQEEIRQRLLTNPTPDPEELSAGAYREQIEAQCREAIFRIRRKGYDTFSSGFGSGNTQVLNSHPLNLDVRAMQILNRKGYIVYKTSLMPDSICFRPPEADIEKIREQWDALAELLPDLNHPAKPMETTLQGFKKWFLRQHPEFKKITR